MSQELLTTEGLPQILAGYDFNDEYRVPLMSQPPTMDGYVREEEWRCAAGFGCFLICR